MSDTSKILVISDVHGRLRELRWLLDNETADALFYLGDGLYDLDNALESRKTPVPYPIYRVAGNCDTGYQDPTEGLVPFAGVLFFYTHGHLYQVKWTFSELLETASARAPMWRSSATPIIPSWCRGTGWPPPCSIPAVCGTNTATASLK